MNPSCIAHYVIKPKRPATAPSTRTKELCSAPAQAVAPGECAAPSASIEGAQAAPSMGMGSPSAAPVMSTTEALPSSKQSLGVVIGDASGIGALPKPPPAAATKAQRRPTSARPPPPTVLRTASGQLCVEHPIVASREVRSEDIDPQLLYRHAEVYRFALGNRAVAQMELVSGCGVSRPSSAKASAHVLTPPQPSVLQSSSGGSSAEGALGPPVNPTPVAPLHDRIKLSEDRMMRYRGADARRQGDSTHKLKNEPPSLALYISRLQGGHGSGSGSTMLQGSFASLPHSVDTLMASTVNGVEKGEPLDGQVDLLGEMSDADTEALLRVVDSLLDSTEQILFSAAMASAAGGPGGASWSRRSLTGTTASAAVSPNHAASASSFRMNQRRQLAIPNTLSAAVAFADDGSRGALVPPSSPKRPRGASVGSFDDASDAVTNALPVSSPTGSWSSAGSVSGRNATEREVLRRMRVEYDGLIKQLHATRGDARRQEINASIERLEALRRKCRSATAGVDFTQRKQREAFITRHRIDALTQEELDARLYYGDLAKRVVHDEVLARSRALAASIASKPVVVPEEREEAIRQRRIQQLTEEKQRHQSNALEWKVKVESEACHSASYGERVVLCARNETTHRCSEWEAVLMVLRFPRVLVQRHAVVMERLLLATKKKEEHVACFIDKMRGALLRRRRRVARRVRLILKLATTLLVTLALHRKRRQAVGDIVAWFQEYKRFRPASDIVRSFKRAIVRSQRICRSWMKQTRIHLCWFMVRWFQCTDQVHALPPKGSGAAVGRSGLGASASSSRSGRSGSVAKFASESAIVDRILAHVVPPFNLREAAAWQLLRRTYKEHSVLLGEHLVKVRKEKRRAALGFPPDPANVTSKAPFLRCIPSDALIHEAQRIVRQQFQPLVAAEVKKEMIASQKTAEETGMLPQPAQLEASILSRVCSRLRSGTREEELRFIHAFGEWVFAVPSTLTGGAPLPSAPSGHPQSFIKRKGSATTTITAAAAAAPLRTAAVAGGGGTAHHTASNSSRQRSGSSAVAPSADSPRKKGREGSASGNIRSLSDAVGLYQKYLR